MQLRLGSAQFSLLNLFTPAWHFHKMTTLQDVIQIKAVWCWPFLQQPKIVLLTARNIFLLLAIYLCCCCNAEIARSACGLFLVADTNRLRRGGVILQHSGGRSIWINLRSSPANEECLLVHNPTVSKYKTKNQNNVDKLTILFFRCPQSHEVRW